MEIAHDWEPWLERATIHLQAKLERENKDLDLQRKMTKHYAWRNQVAREKIKKDLIEIQPLKGGKYQKKLGFLAQDSLQVSQNP